MVNKKLFKSGVLITVVMLSVSGCAGGCSKQAEPVIAESTEETPEPEESIPEESEESLEPTPSPTVEPEESIPEESSSSEVDTSEGEEVVQDESEPTDIEIVEELDLTMYAQTACNARSGDSTDYEKVTSMSKGESVHVTGKTSNDWYRVDWNNGIVYISSSLLRLEKPVAQQQSSSSTGGNGSGGGQSSDGGELPNVGDTIWGQDEDGHGTTFGGEFSGLGDL